MVSKDTSRIIICLTNFVSIKRMRLSWFAQNPKDHDYDYSSYNYEIDN